MRRFPLVFWLLLALNLVLWGLVIPFRLLGAFA